MERERERERMYVCVRVVRVCLGLAAALIRSWARRPGEVARRDETRRDVREGEDSLALALVRERGSTMRVV